MCVFLFIHPAFIESNTVNLCVSLYIYKYLQGCIGLLAVSQLSQVKKI